ncbi:MAG: 2-C-methyl-D-erythritol 4-phosphate cytidylyltransferase [Eubacteriales bacterium]
MTDSSEERMPVRLYVIIPAAGLGQRMGGTSGKQFIPIGGIPVLARTLLAFEHYCLEQQKAGPFSMHGILVTTPQSVHEAKKICDDFKITFVEKIIAGGSTRQESVWNGICALQTLAVPPEGDDITFIHDGARCFVDSSTLQRCYDGARKYGVCTAAIPVKDTIKQADPADSCKVIATPDRNTLYAIQTPQAFLHALLVKSYTDGQIEKRTATDDTSLAEMAGLPVYLVEGAYTNIKITTPEDLLLAELLKNHQKPVLP